ASGAAPAPGLAGRRASMPSAADPATATAAAATLAPILPGPNVGARNSTAARPPPPIHAVSATKAMAATVAKIFFPFPPPLGMQLTNRHVPGFGLTRCQ